MRKFKVIIIMIVVLMVFNASASELQHFSNEPFNASQQANKKFVGEEQKKQLIVLIEETTNFCEEKTKNT